MDVSLISMTELGIYLSWKKDPEKLAYNLPFLMPLPQGTDIEKLRAALVRTFAAHRGLLARFKLNGNGSVTRIMPEGELDESSVSITVRDEEPKFDELVKPFSDTEGELYRIVILKGDSQDWLFMDIHHLVFDGTSMRIFISELNRAYAGEHLVGEQFTVSDIAIREQDKRKSRAFEEAEEWYRQLLGDNEYNSVLIHDKEGSEKKCAYIEHELSVDPEEVAEFADSLGIRKSTFFAGAYGYLIGRFSGSKGALYSTVHSGRDKFNAGTVGMFVKTIPVMQDFSNDDKIKEHLRRLDEQITGSRKADVFSYADISDKFAPNIPTLFAYQGEMFKKIDFLSGEIRTETIPSGDVQEDMVTEVFRDDGRYIIRIAYRRDLFEHSSIGEFVNSYEKTLNEMLKRERLAEVDIVTDDQLTALNGFILKTAVAPRHNDIVSMFRDAAASDPSAPAVIFGDVRLSYSELDITTDRIASYLKEKGIGSGSVTAILIHRNEYMVSASLGVLKSGAAYLPLDPSYPPERLNFMAKDAGASYLIADKDLAHIIEDFEDRVILTDDIPSLPAPDTGCSGTVVPHEDDLFTLLYTSGSTGTPKGVMLGHGNIANFCRHYVSETGLGPGIVCSAYASYGFDANMMDMYPALISGACVCIVPEEIRMDLKALGKYLEKNNVSVAFMTTQVGRQFAMSKYRPSCLKKLLVGGERLADVSVPEDLELINVYGPTECTVFVTRKIVNPHERYLRIPVGSSFAGAVLYVVDEHGRRVPPCVPGELWISGPCVAIGYLNRNEKNAEIFTINPFSSEKGYERVYHTGDIVRFLPDGEIDFIGRSDGQVKIRGFRIELSEVESVIREHPDVEDVTVQAFDNKNGSGRYLAAYVVEKEGSSIERGELEAFIRNVKPPYMVPAAIIKIDEIPLNQNQKVDKRRLPEPDVSRQGVKEGSVREFTELEKELFEILAQATGYDGSDITIPLVETGLTSISAMQLISILSERYGFSPDTGRLLTGLSILDIENEIFKYLMSRDGGTDMVASGLKRDRAILRAPLTQTQLGIYLECKMDERSDKYNIPLLFKLDDAVDMAVLRDAVRTAIEAHPFMKCCIEATENGSADMILNPDIEWEIKTEDTQLSDNEIQERFKTESVLFKLSRAPLFDIRIINSAGSGYLFMVFHHIIMDGTSVSVLMEDIESAYQGHNLTKESYDSMSLAVDEDRERGTEALKKARDVYNRIFDGVCVDSLPYTENVTTHETRSRSGAAAVSSYILDGVDESCIDAFCRENKVTENAIFTAAFAYMLARMNGSDEAMFACVHNGRTSAKVLRIMGMLVKTYPFYINIDKNSKAEDFVRAVSSRIRELTANELYSFAEAVRDHDVNADVMFAYQGDSFNGYTIGGKRAELIEMPIRDAKEPLSVDVSRQSGKYRITFEYREDMYTAVQTEWMSGIYALIVQGFITRSTLGDIELMNGRSRAFLDEVNDTDVNISFMPVRCLLEKNAAAFPDRTAVVFGDTRVTYKELNESANRIAHGLIDEGATGRISALMLKRSEKVYMVRQGILKAGSAFLSIDPEYPDERVKVMAEDSGAAVLVVSEAIREERASLLSTLKCRVLTVEDMLDTEEVSDPDIEVQKEDPAYCIFTSGSTGRPKGVILTQGNLLNFLDANDKNPEILGYTEYTRNSLALAAITFDVSVMEEFIPLSHGMTVCMASENEIHDPEALASFMIKNEVDMMTVTPSFLSSCIGLPVMRGALKNVKVYDLGAEAFQALLYDKIIAINPDAYIMNGYGPTETTISCTMDRITGTGLITIGRPASNVKAFIVDESGHVMPPLIPGELIIAGEGVGRGYIARPELNEEKFIIFEGLRAYRTGDVAAWTSDGRLRFRGRSDDQVKLRGLRVELSEIENAINSVEGVDSSVAVVRGDEENAFLAGFYTASRKITADEIKSVISRMLTSYMIPGVLMQLDNLPLTANGKVDKRKLPEVAFKPDTREYREPVNEAERDFCAWFAEVLHLDKVSAAAGFFELGGTSLSASAIAMHARDKGYNVVYADIFKAQTPEALARIAAGETMPAMKSDEAGNDITDYDYDALNMSDDQDIKLSGIKPGAIGNIMVTGALGFLGIHVLREYLLGYTGTVYCMARGKNCERRLKSLYFYYFSEMPDRYFESGRLKIITGDITDEEALEKAGELPFDTLINCAAIVKHFVKDDSIFKTNVGGVKNLIRLCKKKGIRLIQTSTVSVAGEGLDGTPAPDKMLKENELYIGQLIDNDYIRSKFLAERAVLEAVTHGLDAKIMRLGNLMGRSADGEFQINFRTNAFIRSLASYKKIGAVPYSMLNVCTDFSEIDMTARAVLKLAGTARKYNIFHAMNNHSVTYADIVYSMRKYGMKVDTVDDDEFESRMASAGDAAGALMAYSTREGQERRYMLGTDCSFTTNALYRLGFKWPVTDEDYIVKMLDAMNGMSMMR